MRLKLAAGNHLVAALAQYASLRIQSWLNAHCPFQQHTLLSRSVLHWLIILQHQTHSHMAQLPPEHGLCLLQLWYERHNKCSRLYGLKRHARDCRQTVIACSKGRTTQQYCRQGKEPRWMISCIRHAVKAARSTP